MIYNASAKKHQEGSELMMQYELIGDGKPVYHSEWHPVASRVIGENKKGLEVAGQISLENVKPGIYQLRITVKDPISNRTAQQVATLEGGP